MTTLATSSGTITLPDDIPWIDEFAWSPVAQQIDISLGGSLLIEVSTQAAGRPITLAGDKNTAWISVETLDALRAAEVAQGSTPFTLTLADGRTFSVLFYGGQGSPAVKGEVIEPITPRDSTERSGLNYFVVIKLIQVA